MDGAESWDTGEAIKFRAYGSVLINLTTDIDLTFENLSSSLTQLTKTVRTALASDAQTSLDLNGTEGISKGATLRGFFIDNSSSSSAATVATVTGHLTQGSITVSNGELNKVKVGTKLYVDGFSKTATLKGTIKIKRYPSSDQNIYLDIDKIFTLGAAS